jgi:hypothetical protein
VAAALRLLGTPVEVAGPTQPHQLRVGKGAAAADLFVVQKAHPRSVASQLERAATAARERTVVAVREAARPFPTSWKQVAGRLDALVREPRASWMELARDEVAGLLAVHDLLASARSQDLTGKDGRPIAEQDVRSWARERLGVRDWGAIAVLLGKATGTDAAGTAGDDSSSGAATSDRRPAPDLRAASEPILASDPRPSAPPPGSDSRAGAGGRTDGDDPRVARIFGPPTGTAAGIASRDSAPARPSSTALVRTGPLAAAPGGRTLDPATPPPSTSRRASTAPARDPVVAAIRRLRLASIDRIVREARAVDPELLLSTALERLRALASRLRWFGRSIVWWDEEDEP